MLYEMSELNERINKTTDPRILSSYYSLRSAEYMKIGNIKQAMADINKAIELNHRQPLHYYTRGTYYEESGDLKEALADFKNCLIYSGEYDEISYATHGNAYIKLKDYANAIKMYTKAINMEGGSYIHSRRGDAYRQNNQLLRALFDYRVSNDVKDKPKVSEVHSLLLQKIPKNKTNISIPKKFSDEYVVNTANTMLNKIVSEYIISRKTYDEKLGEYESKKRVYNLKSVHYNNELKEIEQCEHEIANILRKWDDDLHRLDNFERKLSISEEQRLDNYYNEQLNALNKAKLKIDYEKIINALEFLENYKDSQTLIATCKIKIDLLIKEEQEEKKQEEIRRIEKEKEVARYEVARYKARIRRELGRQFSLLLISLAALLLFLTVILPPMAKKDIGGNIGACIFIVVVYAGIYAYIRTGVSLTAKIIWTILTTCLGVGGIFACFDEYGVYCGLMAVSTMICYLAGCILAIIFTKLK